MFNLKIFSLLITLLFSSLAMGKDVTVYFKKPTHWKDAKIYYWNLISQKKNLKWPGITMTALKDSWYKYTFSSKDLKQVNLIFNDGKNNQTPDLIRSKTGWYDKKWYDTDPEVDTIAPTINVTPDQGRYSAKSLRVALKASDRHDKSPVIYYTTDGSKPTLKSKKYSAPILINDKKKAGLDARIKAISIDKSENISSIYTFDYYLGEPKVARNDFREESIYFLLTARFYNGDKSNDYYNRDRIKIGDPQWRGDFKGLIQKLDYIKDLGFTAIWVTPPVENRSGLDYHGYHAYDWNKVDPRLESPGATYKDLINAAHRKGLKIVQDVVINHSSQYGIRGKVWIDHLPIKYYRPHGGEIVNIPYRKNLGDYKSKYRDDNDNPVAPKWFKDRHSSDPDGIIPLLDPKTGEIVPKNGYNPNRFFGIDANNLDPKWYHQEGFIMGGDWESQWPLQMKHMAGDTIDLATERQNVKDYLNNAIYKYLDMGVDAIRIDTVKHVERNNLLEYVNAWKRRKPNLFVFGENLVKGTGWGDLGGDNAPSTIRPWWYTRLGNDRRNPHSGGDSGFSVLDFSLFSTFRDNLSRGHYRGIGGILSMDWIYGDATKLVTFLQNHDVGPDNDFKYRYKGDTWMAAASYNLLWTIRGIPCLYYGEEIEFMKGAPQDIQSNNDTLDTTGRAYFGDHLSSKNISRTKSHPLFKHIKRLNLIRRSIPALQKAPMNSVSEWGSGMSFIRHYKNSYVVVGLSMGSAQDISKSGIKNGTYVDAVTGNKIHVTNGSINFHVKSNSAGIYVLGGSGKIGRDGPFLR